MSHPVHSEAWKHIDPTYPYFSLDPRSVHLGLCTDAFNPFTMSNVQYSCWLVIMTVYNLPPWMCKKQDNMFFSMVIRGPKSPGKNLDVYLRPLIDELKILWDEGVETYDMHAKQNFHMKAASMWTISDFSGYDSCHPNMPLENNETSSIKTQLDVMHMEKNVFDNIFNKVMDIKGKTKDNFKARKDLELYCNRFELHIYEDERGKLYMPKVAYSLTKEQKREVCTWIKKLRMSDGYASNIARCIKGDCEFYGMESHDCHIFMQRFLPIAFKDVLPKPIWEVLTELEKIFPPSFFDSMEHLPIHLAYEAKVGGPVQYRWMFLHHLKKKVKNRAHVEASIVEAYLVEETSTFCSLYFEQNIETRLNHVPRNDDGGFLDPKGCLSIFSTPERPLGTQHSNFRLMTDKEFKAASLYVLLNCQEVTPFVEQLDKHMKMVYPQVFEAQFDRLRDERFSCWLREYVLDDNNIVDPHIKAMALGPSRTMRYYNRYFVNGFKFHTLDYGKHKTTMNSSVCVLGSYLNDYEFDYYVTDDVFILAHQAQQVYYTSSPSKTRDRLDWWAVVKTKAKNVTNIQEIKSKNEEYNVWVELASQED
ncbi:uncharacterized protein LOC111394201 [Olea europaea var. sylvestris]|uniref:uncharacterized protein LOC111394201 n=1 Tax=Olea europaea var. sylvestris TaxID=158386 RepID=UPI000C1D16B8|nr:uncharacterized protein LOC111394201 [Olea europaea var. sylvestris]